MFLVQTGLKRERLLISWCPAEMFKRFCQRIFKLFSHSKEQSPKIFCICGDIAAVQGRDGVQAVGHNESLAE